MWGKQAETCGQYLSKGRQVYVEGRITTRSYDDKDGNKRYTTEIVARDVRFLGGGGGSGAGKGQTTRASSPLLVKTPAAAARPTTTSRSSPLRHRGRRRSSYCSTAVTPDPATTRRHARSISAGVKLFTMRSDSSGVGKAQRQLSASANA